MFKNSRKFYKISSPETLLISQTSGGVLLVVTITRRGRKGDATSGGRLSLRISLVDSTGAGVVFLLLKVY